VRVTLRREMGKWRAPYGISGKATGNLRLALKESPDDRRLPVLILDDADRASWPLLFDPRVVQMAGWEMRWLGFEYVDRGWHMQEWDCEILRE